MAGEPLDLMARVDGLLASGALKPAPRALLLLKLCQVAGVLLPQKAELYWQQLKDQTGSLPGEFKSDLEAVRQMFEVEAASTDKFVVGTLAEINAALSQRVEAVNRAQGQLQACEQGVRKRLWPFGKSSVWEALVLAWAQVDREQSLRLSGELSASRRTSFCCG